MPNHTQMSFLLWNARSLQSRMAEFTRFLSIYLPTVVCLVETWFTPTSQCVIPGYAIYRADRIGRRRGGVAVLVRDSVAHHRVTFDVPADIEAIAVQIHSRHQPLTIATVYLPPNAPFPSVSLSNLTKLGPRLILAGDYNSRHIQWGCSNTTWRGKCLLDFVNFHNLYIHSTFSPTYVPDNSKLKPSVLDLVISTHSQLVLHVSVNMTLYSDHYPVLGLLDLQPDLVAAKKRLDYRRADWSSFRRLLDRGIQLQAPMCTPQDIECQVEYLTHNILQAAKSTIPLAHGPRIGPAFPLHIRQLMTERNACRRRWQQTHSASDKEAYRILYRQCQSSIKAWSTELARRRISTLSSATGSLWRFVRRLKSRPSSIPSLQTDTVVIDSSTDKAELLATHFEGVFHTHSVLPHLTVLPPELISELQQEHFPVPGHLCTSPREISKVIDGLRITAASGHDDMPVCLLRALSKKSIVLLTSIYNAMLRVGYYPTSWKHAILIPILKSSSPANTTTSYRPIALLPALAKIMDRLLEKHLRFHAESFQILPLFQFGFRSKHSASHAVARIVQQTTTAFNNQEHTILVLLDFNKAFDSVPHAALINKLASYNTPLPLLKILYSFLHQRSFQVRVERTLSSVLPICAGVPQGSSLSPLLFALYTADMNLPSPLQLQLYADDTAVSCSGRNATTLVARVQGGLRLLLEYSRLWGLHPNPKKTQTIFLTRRRNFLPPKIWFMGVALPWQITVKYLGVTMDRPLSWLTHSDLLANRANRALFTLAPILKPASPLDIVNRLALFRLYILPILLYAVGVWAYAPRSSWRKVRTIYHRGIRLLLGRPRNTPIRTLLHDSEFPPFMDLVYDRADVFFRRCRQHKNPLIANFSTDLDPQLRCHKGILDYRRTHPP